MIDKNKIVLFWINDSDRDYRTMQHLLEKGHYVWAMFIGHLVLEKLLKALYVKRKEVNNPFTHDLLRLAEAAGLILTDIQKDELDMISTFNIRARYDDFKEEFRKKCNKKFALKWESKIKGMRQWIKKQL
jgi:HEPN domain-containing protein